MKKILYDIGAFVSWVVFTLALQFSLWCVLSNFLSLGREEFADLGSLFLAIAFPIFIISSYVLYILRIKINLNNGQLNRRDSFFRCMNFIILGYFFLNITVAFIARLVGRIHSPLAWFIDVNEFPSFSNGIMLFLYKFIGCTILAICVGYLLYKLKNRNLSPHKNIFFVIFCLCCLGTILFHKYF